VCFVVLLPEDRNPLGENSTARLWSRAQL